MRMYYKIWCWPSRLWFFFYLSITNYIAFCQGRRLRVAAHLTLYFSVDLLKRPSKGIIKVWVPLLAFEKLMLPNTIRFLLLCSSSKSARRKATEKFARELDQNRLKGENPFQQWYYQGFSPNEFFHIPQYFQFLQNPIYMPGTVLGSRGIKIYQTIDHALMELARYFVNS